LALQASRLPKQKNKSVASAPGRRELASGRH
jgi:hypothetical protein